METVSDVVSEVVSITESRGVHHFDRMGRPVTVFDQRSNHNTSIMLEWHRHLVVWQNTQVPHNIS